MSSANSYLLKLSKKNFFLKKIYLYYNVYIRNLKFYFSSSQFDEEKKIIKQFEKNYKGFFVDIGSFHPTRGNNTFKLYKLGWKGINIDLNPLSIDLFNTARPRDINICAAVSSKKGSKVLYYDHELSPLNTLEKNHTFLIKKHFGIKNLKKKKIRTVNFNNLIKKYKIKFIDFLNIDIEGHEFEVLKMIDFNHFKINVICVEILSHNKSSKKNTDKIIKFLKKKKYKVKGKTRVNYIFKSELSFPPSSKAFNSLYPPT
jgi:FkbM family methyltransferase